MRCAALSLVFASSCENSLLSSMYLLCNRDEQRSCAFMVSGVVLLKLPLIGPQLRATPRATFVSLSTSCSKALHSAGQLRTGSQCAPAGTESSTGNEPSLVLLA